VDDNLSTHPKSTDENERRSLTWMSTSIKKYYAPFLMHPIAKLTVFAIYIVYIMTAIIGCFNVKQGLEPVTLLLPDSYAVKYYRRMEQYFWAVGM